MKIWLCGLISFLSFISIQAQSFTDISKAAGINHLPHRVENVMKPGWGGICVIDYNNDGYDDLYLPGGDTSDILYRNNKDGTFTDVTKQSGIKKITDKYVTLGAIAGDINNDGFTDLFITTFSFRDSLNTFASPILLKNNGNGTFTDISMKSNIGRDTFYSGACSFGDINNDGYLDIFVGNMVSKRKDYNSQFFQMNKPYTWEMGPDKLYLNNKNGTFTDIAKEAGVVDPGASLGATFFDFNNDANIDLYTANDYWATPNGLYPNILFKNQYPKLAFTDISKPANVNDKNTSMGVAVGDYDENGFLDLYVTYCGSKSLFRNNGDGTFTNMAVVAGVADKDVPINDSLNDNITIEYKYQPYPGFVGLDSSKFEFCHGNNINCTTYTLYMNVVEVDKKKTDYHPWIAWKYNDNGTASLEVEKDKIFDFCINAVKNKTMNFGVMKPKHGDELITRNSKILPSTSWGANFLDYDNDGRLDLYVANGSEGYTGAVTDNTNSLYQNIGNGRFKNVSENSGANTPWSSRGSVILDYDNDGDEDIFVMNMPYDAKLGLDRSPYSILYRNNLVKDGYNNWLEIKLKGVASNSEGVGAMIKAHIGFRTLIRQIDGGSSHMSSNSKVAHFGLGPYRKVDSLEIIWPGGCKQMVYNVSINQKLVVIQNCGEIVSNNLNTSDSVSVKAVFNKLNDLIDFDVVAQDKMNIKLEVYDNLGNSRSNVFFGDIDQKKQYHFSVDTKKFKAGTYIYKIITPKGVFCRKIKIVRV